MRFILREKFRQNPILMNILKSTGDKYLYEASPYDDYWGTGKHGTGKNMLGQLLMELRDSV